MGVVGDSPPSVVGDDVCAPQQALDDDSKDCSRRIFHSPSRLISLLWGLSEIPRAHISKVCLSMLVDMIGTRVVEEEEKKRKHFPCCVEMTRKA